MKKIRFWANLSIAAVLTYIATSCAGSHDYLSKNFQQLSSSHRTIAILPFDVRFPNSDNQNRNYNNYRGQQKTDQLDANTPHVVWSKQEQQGSLDMQKDLFVALVKQGQKGRYGVTFQDFNQTNKILEANNIMLNDVTVQDKGKLAQLLGVDAVIWGKTVVKITHSNRPFYGGYGYGSYGYAGHYNDGVETVANIYDAATGELLWSTSQLERPNSRLSTPHDLADNVMNYVAKRLPYRLAKR